MNKFDKVKFLQKIGLLNARFNYETLKFERSWTLRLVAYWATFIKVMVAIRIVASYFFEREDEIQLLWGNPYNFFSSAPKFYVSLAAVTAGTWGIGHHYVMNHLNAKDDYYLFRQWMYLTQEIPSNRLVGLSKEVNDQFWQTVDWFNQLFCRSVSYSVIPMSLVIAIGLFVVRFENVNFWVFLCIQAINFWHIPAFFYYFFHSIHSVNVMYIEVMLILKSKFNSIASRAAELNVRETKTTDNRKLSRLLFEHNKVHVELQEMNAFFSNFVSCNLIHLFSYGIMVAFVGLFLDWRLKIAFFLIMLGLFVTVIFLPFVVANTAKTEINRAKRQFENVAFRPSVHLVIKQKISGLDDKAGFTCASWFLLSSFTGLLLSLELMESNQLLRIGY